MNMDENFIFKIFSAFVGTLILVFGFLTFLVVSNNQSHFRSVSLDEFYNTKNNQKVVIVNLDEEKTKDIMPQIKELDSQKKLNNDNINEDLLESTISDNEIISNDISNDEKKKISQEFKKKIDESSINLDGKIKKSILDELSKESSIKNLEKNSDNPLETKEEYKSINEYLKDKDSSN
ncbi:MAG: hypothetical protein N4A54_03665 [Peptostreptococcaceae bacterium]|jgi:hypothetical protein|nr:hypothetical protein [Peptostreptococcaceae bacterium]